MGVWLSTHQRSNFSSSVVVHGGQHKRRHEEEEGANSSVNQVLQESTNMQVNIRLRLSHRALFLFKVRVQVTCKKEISEDIISPSNPARFILQKTENIYFDLDLTTFQWKSADQRQFCK